LLGNGNMEGESLKPQLIAIDGPVAAGKSSVGSLLASKLSFVFFDTGMMYRAFTWKAISLSVSLEDESTLSQLAASTRFDFSPSERGDFSFLIDGEDISCRLLCSEVEGKVSLISRVAGIRQAMVSKQRMLAQRGRVVMAGRDIGTVVLPWAELKIFLVASVEERANRRYSELLERGEKVDFAAVLAELRRRDEIDSHRAISPLKPAEDAIIIDTEKLTLHQVVDTIYALAVNR
jgi:cytidylate kinase